MNRCFRTNLLAIRTLVAEHAVNHSFILAIYNFDRIGGTYFLTQFTPNACIVVNTF